MEISIDNDRLNCQFCLQNAMQNMDALFPRTHSWMDVMNLGGLRGTPLICAFYFSGSPI